MSELCLFYGAAITVLHVLMPMMASPMTMRARPKQGNAQDRQAETQYGHGAVLGEYTQQVNLPRQIYRWSKNHKPDHYSDYRKG